MIAERPDWCISRQRFWGVPLIIFYCDACGKQLRDYAGAAPRAAMVRARRRGRVVHAFGGGIASAGNEVLVRRGELAQGKRRSGRVVRFRLDASRRAERKGRHVACGCVSRRARTSIAAGSTVRCWWPWAFADARRTAQVVTHGWTLDEKGAPMSKSLGNAMYPNEICEKWGADLLRVWVASQDYTADMRMSDSDDDAAFRGVSQDPQHLPLRALESFRFRSRARRGSRRRAVGNGRVDASPHRRAGAAVPRMVRRISNFIAPITRMHDFCAVDLSAFYFDVLKDRLYTFAPRNVGRRSAQTAVYRIASALVRLIAPTLVFTAEEVWKYLPRERRPSRKACTWRCFPQPRNLKRPLTSSAREKLGAAAGRARGSAEGSRAGARREADFRSA